MNIQRTGQFLLVLLLSLIVITPAVSATVDGSTWAAASSTAPPFAPRTNFGITDFGNTLYVTGGEGTSFAMGDVWASTNGVIWNQVTSSAPWTGRSMHTVLTFNNKMWIMGGNPNGLPLNDVWSTGDGTTWTQTTAHAGWSTRSDHSSVVYNNKMWVMGGQARESDTWLNKNDVWYSTDGATWTQATANAAWAARRGAGVVFFDNKMWLMGGSGNGGEFNDVWYSTDGVTWSQATANAGWTPRPQVEVVVYDNKMWVLGSRTGSDIWYSTNGITWTQATANAGWGVKTDYSGIKFGDSMWVIGGTLTQDTLIWHAVAAPPIAAFTGVPTSGTAPQTVQFTDASSPVPSSWEWDFNNDGTTDSTAQNPSFTYNTAGTYSVRLTVTKDGVSNSTIKTNYITIVPPAPVASFSGTPTSGNAPLTVQFTDGSSNTPTSWAWDFNDDGTTDSTAQNPSFTYNAAGTYSVRLTATNAGGSNSSTKSNYITVTSATGPVLSFQPGSTNVHPGVTTDYVLVLSSAPAGFSGYNISVALTNTSVGSITNVTYPTWKILTNTSALPSGNVKLKMLGNTSETTNITLCTISVQGTSVGMSGITVTASKITDGSGGQISSSLVPSTLTVTAVQPIIQFPGQTNAPTDPNNDGIYEDINGNGNIEMNDVLVYYYNMVTWIAANEPIAPFDYNSNGLIDFDDVVRLFDLA